MDGKSETGIYFFRYHTHDGLVSKLYRHHFPPSLRVHRPIMPVPSVGDCGNKNWADGPKATWHMRRYSVKEIKPRGKNFLVELYEDTWVGEDDPE